MFYRGPFRGDNNFFNYPANLFWKLSNLIFPPPPPRLELYRENGHFKKCRKNVENV